MNTMSVRGTMTSRTRVSPSSKTEWIISRSSGSMTLRSSARSTRSRSSASEVNGPSLKPLPGVTALPSSMRSLGRGPKIRVRPYTTGALASAIGSACWRPSVRGETPTTT